MNLSVRRTVNAVEMYTNSGASAGVVAEGFRGIGMVRTRRAEPKAMAPKVTTVLIDVITSTLRA